MKDKLIQVVLLTAIVATLVAVSVWVLGTGQAIAPPEAPVERAASPWPGEVRLWNADTAITQTTLYRGIDMTGSEQRYVFFDTGIPSTTGTVTITTKTMWRDVEFVSTETAGSPNPSAAATGCITVATGTPYYPTLLVGVEISAGTFTPTIAVVAQ